jgi:hypothetical protein
MKAPNLLALTASTLIVGAALFVLRSADSASIPTAPPLAMVVNGIRVIQLDTIVVRPTAAQGAAATSDPLTKLAPALARQAQDQALGLISSQLAMPFFPLGNVLSNAGKE